MILTDLIKEQMLQCIVMLFAGTAVFIMYQIFRCSIRLLQLSRALSFGAEIMFWLGAAVFAYKFLFYCARGALSFHSAVAFTAGALLWKKFFCDIIYKLYWRINLKQGKSNKYGEEEKKQPIQREQSSN